MDIPWDQSGNATPRRDEALIPWVGERGIDARMGSVRPSDAMANWRVAWSGLHGSLDTLAAGESPTTSATAQPASTSTLPASSGNGKSAQPDSSAPGSANRSCAGSQEEKRPRNRGRVGDNGTGLRR